MLKKIPVSDIKEGMRFSADLFFDDGKSLLAPKGMPLKVREIRALNTWKLEYVLSAGVPLAEGEYVDEVGLEELEDVDVLEDLSDENPSLAQVFNETPKLDEIKYSSEQIIKLPAVLENNSVYEKYKLVIAHVDTVFNEIKNNNFDVSKKIDKIVSSILFLIQTEKSQIVGFILGAEITDKLLAKSSVNTAILSLIIAEHLEFPRHRLVALATAAILHDIGMLKVPDSIINKDGKLEDGETHTMRSHTNYGYKIISQDLVYPEEIARVALQHQEHWDGQGYPSMLAGEKIDVLARIIAVADAFEAMVSPKSWRNSMVGYKAMKNLLADNGRRFDPTIIRAMIQSMGIYPIGSVVLLNNSAIARVIESHIDTPLRPVIRVLIDEFGKAYLQNEGDLIDLKTDRNIFIARAIEPSEYRPIK